ncbi:OsmC family protein [Paenibacillus xerothermodurans]|uniref:OsmC family peroxiredoxin n=1 Tax=Paenibacillus xerothermodurans TaxID=1977292 RepID=A0A2W1P392_PAEXE|nr:OsmC family protein [Paenibacillus xerothermodurans]PZE21638.1 OsmC family peroxiredoxin [Paenibacillus xerothermodurans]
MSTQEKDAKSEVRRVRAASQRLGRFKNENTVRGFTFRIDEPEKLGGTDTGPTPMEYVLGSFNGCLLIVIETIASEMKLNVKDLRAESTGLVDRRGLFGTADVTPHFLEVHNSIVFDTDEPWEKIELLKQAVLKRCPAYNLFKDAGIPITLDWTRAGGSEQE